MDLTDDYDEDLAVFLTYATDDATAAAAGRLKNAKNQYLVPMKISVALPQCFIVRNFLHSTETCGDDRNNNNNGE